MIWKSGIFNYNLQNESYQQLFISLAALTTVSMRPVPCKPIERAGAEHPARPACKTSSDNWSTHPTTYIIQTLDRQSKTQTVFFLTQSSLACLKYILSSATKM